MCALQDPGPAAGLPTPVYPPVNTASCTAPTTLQVLGPVFLPMFVAGHVPWLLAMLRDRVAEWSVCGEPFKFLVLWRSLLVDLQDVFHQLLQRQPSLDSWSQWSRDHSQRQVSDSPQASAGGSPSPLNVDKPPLKSQVCSNVCCVCAIAV